MRVFGSGLGSYKIMVSVSQNERRFGNYKIRVFVSQNGVREGFGNYEDKKSFISK